MAGMFIGDFTFKVDGKGRMSIPADYRRELEQNDPSWADGLRPKVAIVQGSPRQTYLEAHTIADFKALAAEITAMDRGDMHRKVMERFILGTASILEIDPDGRLVLPGAMREKIDLAGEARIMGLGQTFRIWKPDTFVAHDVAGDWLMNQDDDFDIYALLPSRRPA